MAAPSAFTATVLIAATVFSAPASPDVARSEFRAAVTQARDGDLQADWNKLAEARERIAGFTADRDLAALAHYHLGYTDWRMSSLVFIAIGPNAQKPLLERAVDNLEMAIRKRPDFPDAQALLASCLSILIAVDPARQEALVARIRAAWTAALPALDSNPRVMLLRAISLVFGPPPYGNREKGLDLWRQAIARFEQTRGRSDLPDWGDAEALAWLGGAHLMTGDYAQAAEWLGRAVKLRPDFWWAGKAALPVAQRPPK